MSSDAGQAVGVSVSPRVVATHALSRTQAQVWTSQQLNRDVPLANMGKRHRLRGVVDPARLVDSFRRVVVASDALRTTVRDRRGADPVAQVLADPPASTEVVDLPIDRLDDWCRERIATPIDMTTCGYDSVLLRHADDDWTWWLDLHHVVTDAWASSLVFDAVSATYAALADGSLAHESDELATSKQLGSFYDHVATASERATPEARAERAAAWAADAAADTDGQITPYGARRQRTTVVDRLPVTPPDPAAVDAALTGPYRTLSRELSLLGVLVASFAATMHRLDGRSHLVVGVPLHHRSGPIAPNVIGPLMELYPLRVDVDHADTFASLYAHVQERLVAMLRRAKPTESPDAAFEVVVNVLTARYGDLADVPTETEWMRSGHVESAHAVRVQAYDYGGDLRVELDLNRGLSIDGAHRAMPEHLGAMLRAALADEASAIRDVELASDEDCRAFAGLNPPASAAHRERSSVPAHVQIAANLRTRPDWVVAEHDGAELSAAELDQRADALATHLIRAGVERGDRVGVRIARSLDVLVAVHGAMRAGAAFVMMDPADPPARHEAINSDADLRLVIDDVDDFDDVDDADRGPVDQPEIDLDDTAYVLFTSGSTGVPKGVPISHRGLSDYLSFAVDAYTDEAHPPVMPLHSALVFDLTITSLFLPQLTFGRTIVCGGDALASLSQIAHDRRITLLKATPSQLELLTRMIDGQHPLRRVIVGGEAFRTPVAQAFAASCEPGLVVDNEYGPTEAVVGCMIHEWNPDRDHGTDVPIGRACPGAAVHVLDRHGRMTPPGVWGELYVGRPGMATGYLNRPELTAERFVTSGSLGLDGPDRLLYRTGDRVRFQSGSLVYGGRLDDQMKVNGVRIEPGEVEAALVRHPAIANAVVRVWEPAARSTRLARCVRCGLGSDVPAVQIDDEGVCSTCRDFERVAPQTESWFRKPDDLAAARDRARARRRGEYDCLHLLSGGKDSTYALYQLVEQGWNVHALTLDNGFISDGAKANVRRSVDDLGITHEFVTTDAMNDIFRDSLDRFANVCNGCYKTIYTLAVARARELGIPVIVTGLSRGQFFETRLVPHQFEAGRFDPDSIDDTVLHARRTYHHTTDAVTELLPEQTVFTPHVDGSDVLDEIEFVDFYRYVDVDLADLYDFLESRAPWVRPADTGRSTNCLVNAAGIYVHRAERGYHNYAEPYSWDVRLGHKTRAEALDELDDEIDEAEVLRMLAEIGYEPKVGSILTAWYQTNAAGTVVAPDELRRHLRRLLPEHAVPVAYVRIAEVPMAASAKVDVSALPAPARFERGRADYVAPAAGLEASLAASWASLLGVEQVGATDDFFDLGGASLAALEAVAAAEDLAGVELDDAIVFRHRTVIDLAAHVARVISGAGTEVGARSVDPIPALDHAPVSRGQESLLFDVASDPGSARYGVTRRFRFGDVPIDPRRLRDAIHSAVARHDALRLTFAQPRRTLAVDDAVAWRIFEHPNGDVDALAARQAAEPFVVEDGPRVRATFVVTADTQDLVLSLHHLWCDAGSFDVLWREIGAAYAGRELMPVAARYSDHAAWQRERGDASDVTWWTTLIDGIERSPSLTLPAPREPTADGYVRRRVDLEPSGRSGPIFTRFLAAVGAVLGEYCEDPVVVGVPMTVRDHPDVDDVVGYFLNTVLLPLPEAPMPFGDAVNEVRDTVAAALERRTVPLTDVLAARRAEGRPTDLARIMVVHDPPAVAAVADLPATSETIFNGAAVTELSLLVTETGSGCNIAAEWSGARFTVDAVDILLDQIAAVLTRGCAEPAIRTDRILERTPDLIGPDLGRDEPGSTVIDRIREQAARSPDTTAIRSGEERITYGALLARANHVAAGLRVRGSGAGRSVAVLVDRSVDQIVAILGVLTSGAAYVPIDPQYPAARVVQILAAAQPDLVIASEQVHVPGVRVEVAMLSGLEAAADLAAGSSEIVQSPDLDDHAYVIFTSGSSGTPRGVPVTHRQLGANTAARAGVYPSPPRAFLWTSSVGFDSSIVGLFWTLTSGGELVLCEPGRSTDVDHLVDVIDRSDATHLLMVPSLWSAVLARVSSHGATDRLASLTDVIVAGEAAQGPVVDSHAELLPRCRIWNEYGPTETTVWATVHRCRSGEDPVPIGRPIPGTTVRIADANGRRVPIGGAGELWITGAGLTAGYIDDDLATAQRFVTDRTGRRWYRSGDRVVSDGDVLYFIGRVDAQLSLNGVRIEPEEIEQVLSDTVGVVAAAVCVVPDASSARGELVAVLAVESDEALSAAAVVARTSLPEALVPARWVVVAALPHTAHDKLDRAEVGRIARTAMVTAAGDGVDASQTAQRGALGEMVDAWRTVLSRDDIGPDSDFFDVGGDSLVAVGLAITVEERFDRPLTIAGLISGRTPRRVLATIGVDETSAVEVGDEMELADDRFVELEHGHAGSAITIVHVPAWDDIFGYLPLQRSIVEAADRFGRPSPRQVALHYRPNLRHDVVSATVGPDAILTVPELASVFVADLDKAGVTGEAIVLGWSTSGLVAYEVGRLLADRGDIAVKWIALVDTFFPGEEKRLWANRVAKYAPLLRPGKIGEAAREARVTAARRGKQVAGSIGRKVTAWADPSTAAGAEVPAPTVSTANPDEAFAYEPPRIDTPVVLYAATTTNPGRTVDRWSSVASALSIVSVEGRHRGFESIMDADRVHQIADDLITRL